MIQNKALWATGLAVLALVLHFALPLVVVHDGQDTTTYWATEWNSDGPQGDPVTGASMAVLLVGLILLTLGGVGVWLLARQNYLLQLGAGLVAIVGGSLALIGNGLWAGRGVASLIQLILGSDGPQARTAGLSGDYFNFVWPIAPLLVLPAVALSVWWILDHLAADMPDARHVRPTQWAVIAVLAMTLIPWAIEDGEDALPEVAGAKDVDPFLISGYDAIRLHIDSQAVVAATSEGGLSEYDVVAWVFSPSIVIVAAVASLIGLAGAWRVDQEDKIVGRGLQNGGAILVIGWAILNALGVVFIAIMMTDANEVVASKPVYAPALAAVPFLFMLPSAIHVMRTLGSDRDRLIADRFPEQIVYE